MNNFNEKQKIQNWIHVSFDIKWIRKKLLSSVKIISLLKLQILPTSLN